MLNRILKVIVVLFIIFAALAISVYFIFSLTPNFMRNNDVNGLKLNVKVSSDERNPITRTFKKEE